MRVHLLYSFVERNETVFLNRMEILRYLNYWLGKKKPIESHDWQVFPLVVEVEDAR